MRNVDKKYHYLYKTTNLINGKYYYGMHSTQDLDDGYLGSGKRLRYSIRKYGKDNFKREIIKYFDSREELVQGEIDLITDELLNEDLCMNLKTGGSGGFTSDIAKLGRSAVDIILKEKYGNNFKSEILLKYYNNISDEEKIKRSDNIKKGQINFDHSKTFKDKKHTEETKAKMSYKAKLRIKDKNSQFGTCWITKDGENKKIKKEELVQYINTGWFKGRKVKT